MRILTVSDLHIDYSENQKWLFNLSQEEYQNDVLILAGDITDNWMLLDKALLFLRSIFKEICFVPGNHDLWVRKENGLDSLEKFQQILDRCNDLGIHTRSLHLENLSIIPLYAWYDYSFGNPSKYILTAWNDFTACRWPGDQSVLEITSFFLGLNNQHLSHTKDRFTISFSHFLPRIDLMPEFIPENKRFVYPVLGSEELGIQVDQINSDIHVYGHSHVNQIKISNNVKYINNAFGYPNEKNFTRKELVTIYDC